MKPNPKRVWVVTVHDNGVTRQSFNKVFDAPKYMAVGYARDILRVIGCSRTVRDGNMIWGYLPRSGFPHASAHLELHTLRGRDDNLIQHHDKRGRKC